MTAISEIIKICNRCGETKPREANFRKRSTSKDGYLGICLACNKKYAAEHRKANLRRYREYDRRRGKTAKRQAQYSERNRSAKGRAYDSAYRKRRRREYPEKQRGKNALYAALRNGSIIRPDKCSSCSTECRPHGHHEDYDRPLDITWLCHGCHMARHRQMAAETRKSAIAADCLAAG